MNKKMSKRRRDIKSKLMAAICMLLVSSIMMVSTTYAWFTLSTAPEVTGIQTAVGANGNLEMALLSDDLQETDGSMKAGWGDLIDSAVGDSSEASGQTVEEANVTWGNLVDVSSQSTYGLQHINLYPSKLTAAANGDGDATIGEFPLSHPTYGADGRIIELKADTLTASYASGKFSNEDALGVRAVGTASSMTAREIAHRQALADAATAASEAKTAARKALEDNGNKLAAIAITHVGDNSATFVQSDMDAMEAVLTGVTAAHGKIEQAMKLYVAAHNIAPSSQNDSTYQAVYDEIMGKTLADIAAGSYEKPADFADAYAALQESQERVADAQAALTTATTANGDGNGNYTWTQVSSVLSYIMDYNKMLLCGLTMEEATHKEGNTYTNMGVVVNAMGAGGLKLQMPSGSGVFADIADFCGTYTAGITFDEGTEVMGVPIGGVKATMITEDPRESSAAGYSPIRNPSWLADVRTRTKAFAAAAGGDSGTSITDYYGYIVDLAFRTNAASSNLMLQAEGIDRVYADNTANEATMGGGATMTFTGSENFGAPMVQELMQSIRIVFFETDTSVILGEARLNPATAVIDNVTVTMKMGMWIPTYDDEGEVNGGAFAAENANVITELEQNKAKAISVLVYLDGESVTNADVATTGTSSMTGTMNLQFSSSAELKPMEYTDLREGKSSAADTPSDTPVISAVTTGTVSGGYAATINHVVVGTTSKYVAVITETTGNTAVTENVTVTIGDQTATYETVGGLSGWVADAPDTAPNEAVNVTVTTP